MARDRLYKPETPIKKYLVPQEEIDSIREEAKQAQYLLDNPLLRIYLQNAKNSILELNAKQLVYDAEETTETNGVKTTTKIPARREYIMLAGQYRFIEQLIRDMEQSIFLAKQTDEKIKSEEIEVKEDD